MRTTGDCLSSIAGKRWRPQAEAMRTHSAVRRMSALTLAVILLLVGMPLSTSAKGAAAP